jgi:hypothetical protein
MKSNDPMVTTHETEYWDSFRSPWDPRGWSRKIWLLLVGAVIVIVAAVVGGVVGSRARNNGPGYPDYSKLNYTLIDTCEWQSRLYCGLLRGKGLTVADSGTRFFDKFEYFHDYDPGSAPPPPLFYEGD